MSRMITPAALVALAFLAVPLTSGLTAAPAVGIKLATLAPAGTSYDLILRRMGETWRKATSGEVNLRVYPGGNQGSEADIVRRMNVGELQGAMLSVGGLSEIDPTAAALQEIPMLFRSLAEEEYVRDRMRGDFERRLLARGFVVLFWGDSGWVRFFSRNPGIRPDDFKAMKIFVTASGNAREMQIIQGLGYKPVALDWADALIQLQTGGVDAVPAPPILALSGQYYTAVKHMTEVNWAPLVGAAVVTRRAWDAIPAATRALLTTGAADAGRQMQEASRRESDEAVNTMKTKWGLTVHTLTPDLEQQWRTFAEAIYPTIRGTLVPADVFDEARRLVAEYRASGK
jgi:TRAP-type C4-dicarboxylate transport system substrate-binding protein